MITALIAITAEDAEILAKCVSAVTKMFRNDEEFQKLFAAGKIKEFFQIDVLKNTSSDEIFELYKKLKDV